MRNQIYPESQNTACSVSRAHQCLTSLPSKTWALGACRHPQRLLQTLTPPPSPFPAILNLFLPHLHPQTPGRSKLTTMGKWVHRASPHFCKAAMWITRPRQRERRAMFTGREGVTFGRGYAEGLLLITMLKGTQEAIRWPLGRSLLLFVPKNIWGMWQKCI